MGGEGVISGGREVRSILSGVVLAGEREGEEVGGETVVSAMAGTKSRKDQSRLQLNRRMSASPAFELKVTCSS